MKQRWILALVPLFVAACNSGSGDDDDKDDDDNRDSGWTDEVGDGGSCVDTETPLAWDEQPPAGHSAETSMAYLAPGAVSGFGYWRDGTRFEVSGTVTPDTGSAVWVDSEAAPVDYSEGEQPAIAAYCVDRLEFAFQLQLDSDDGKLALDTPMQVWFSDEEGRSVRGEVDESALVGVDLTEYTDIEGSELTGLSIEVVAAPEEEDLLYAALYVHYEGSDGEVAWAGVEEVLHFTYGLAEEAPDPVEGR